MWPPFFFGVIPTYGVLPYAMIKWLRVFASPWNGIVLFPPSSKPGVEVTSGCVALGQLPVPVAGGGQGSSYYLEGAGGNPAGLVQLGVTDGQDLGSPADVL